VIYSEGVDRAQELAREALNLMAARGIAPTPPNFQIFYAHVSGIAPELTKELDTLGDQAAAYSGDVLEELFGRYFEGRDVGTANLEASEKLQEELIKVLGLIDGAGQDAKSFGGALSGTAQNLRTVPPQDLKMVLDTLVAATRKMSERSEELEKHLQVSATEIRTLRQNLESVQREAMTDPLTGLANRKAFDEKLKEAARIAENGVCLLLGDIDHFKKFNDTWGHQLGDQVLKLVAFCLNENVKGRDTPSRYGGEEFAVVLPGTALQSACDLADQIRRSVESKKVVKKATGELLGRITMSIGAAEYRPGESLQDLIRRADAALYTAKRQGRNRVVPETEIDDAMEMPAKHEAGKSDIATVSH